MQTEHRKIHRPPLLLRIVRARPRLFVSVALGVVVTAGVAVLTHWRLATRLLVGWDLGVGLYLALAFHMMAGSGVDSIRRHAAEQDEGRTAILVLTVAAALASLAAIFAELGTSPSGGGGRQPVPLVLATVTVVLSWAFIHTIFALHSVNFILGRDQQTR